MAAQDERTLNIIRGKNIVGKATKEDVLLLFEHIDALEDLLDSVEEAFGANEWRDLLEDDE